MGELADDMINGCACSLCGQYFVDPKDSNKVYCHWYPVVCKECADDEDGEDVPVAKVNTF